MKQQIVTKAIVLARTDFQEADRILTLLSPDQGKLKVIAKGVRRPRSKLAGGIELLSINDVTILPGRGDLGTLISSRLIKHFNLIVSDINRTMLAYDLLKRINRATEDATEEDYFLLLMHSFEGLNEPKLAIELSELWFYMQLLQANGHAPNLASDSSGGKLDPDARYLFDYETMAFQPQNGASYNARHIKLLRLCTKLSSPVGLQKITDAQKIIPETLKLAKLISNEHL